jgi:DNA ligase-1
MPALITRWLDTLDETGRWALLKLITGGLRIGVSARLAKTAVAGLGDLKPDDIEEVWHGLKPPYASLVCVGGRQGERPENDDPAPFAPAMLAHPIEEGDFDKARCFGVSRRMEMGWHPRAGGLGHGQGWSRCRRLYSRTGDDISAPSPISSRPCPMMPRLMANCWC